VKSPRRQMRLGDFSRKLWVIARQIEIFYKKGGKWLCIFYRLYKLIFGMK
jgi:hypothetical protein